MGDRVTKRLTGKGALAVAVPAMLSAALSACTSLDPTDDTARKIGVVGPSSGGSSGLGTGGSTNSGGGGGSGTGGMGTGGTDQPPGPEWACVGNPVTPPQVTPDAGTMVTYLAPIVDFDSNPPPATPIVVDKLNVKVCDNPDCDPPPAAHITVNQVPGVPYLWSITAPWGTGKLFLRLSAPGYVDLDYYLSGPLVGTPEGVLGVRALPIPVLRIGTLKNLYIGIGLSGAVDKTTGLVDQTRGILAVRFLNCLRDTSSMTLPPTGVRAAHVKLQAIPMNPADPPARAWVLGFNNQATANILETDNRGVAGFANVDAPYNYDIQGIAPFGGGTTYGHNAAYVRPGAITLVEVRDGIDLWGQ